MRWGSHALVVEPEPLREEITKELEDTIERYRSTGGCGESLG